jgi:hypothetical protein
MQYNRIITDLTNQAYHADREAVSNSQLSRLIKSPSLIYAPIKQTPSLRWGTLVHAIILEADKFGETNAVMPEGLDSGKGAKARVEEFEAANLGKEIVSFDEMVQLNSIRKAVFDDPDASLLLGSPARIEQSIFWEDKETGIKCRCRPDFWRNDNVVVDIKTTTDSSSWAFGASVWDWGYDRQAAFYSDGIEAVTGSAPEAFVFIAIEGKDEPNILIECHNAEQDVIQVGRTRYRKALQTLADCRRNNSFPKKLVPGIRKIVLPAYARA